MTTEHDIDRGWDTATRTSSGVTPPWFPLPAKNSYEFTFVEGGSRNWTLTLHRRASLRNLRETASGELTSDGTERFAIDPIYTFQGNNHAVPAPLGFSVVKDGAVSAALDLGSRGTVFLAPSEDPQEKALLAVSLAAILFSR